MATKEQLEEMKQAVQDLIDQGRIYRVGDRLYPVVPKDKQN